MYCERLVPPQAVAVHPYTVPDSSFRGATKSYRKIPKITAPGLLFFKGLFDGPIFRGAYIRKGLCTEGNLRLNDRLGLPYIILGRKFTVFLRFFFHLRAIPKYKAPGAYIGLEGGFNGGFLCYEFGGLIVGGAYTLGGYFRNFTVCGI